MNQPSNLESPPDVNNVRFKLSKFSDPARYLSVDYIDTYKTQVSIHEPGGARENESDGALYIFTNDWTASNLPTAYVLFYWEKYMDDVNPPADNIWAKDYQKIDTPHTYVDANGQEHSDTIYRIKIEQPENNREEYIYGYLASDSSCVNTMAENGGSPKPGNEYKCFDINLYKEFWTGKYADNDLVPVYVKVSLKKDADASIKNQALIDFEDAIVLATLEAEDS